MHTVELKSTHSTFVFGVMPCIALQHIAGRALSRSGRDFGEPSSYFAQCMAGDMKGEVKAESPDGTSNKFQMELQVSEHKDRQRLKWKITYQGDQGKSERNYELVAEILRLVATSSMK